MTTSAAAAHLVAALREWVPPSDQLRYLRSEYLRFVEDRGVEALRRDGGSVHLTASCFIFSTDLQLTLLAFHRKGRFWAQTGGHIEPEDETVASAALREAREEAGIADLSMVIGPLDLDRHELSAAFGGCRTHWDVGWAAFARTDQAPQVSDESEDVAWFPVDDLPTPLAGSVLARISLFRDAIRAGR